MKNMKFWRTALVATLVLTVMLSVTGGTIAWFTDEVTTGVNTISAGNLDVDVHVEDGTSISKLSTLFNDVTLWEPGAVAWENLTVVNEGNLALKYQMTINAANENNLNGNVLSDVLKVGVVANGVTTGATRESVLAAVGEDGWKAFSNYSVEGELVETGASKTYGVVIYWQPTSEDNKWNANNGQKTSDELPLHIDLGIKLQATQLTAEADAFDNQYDKDATYDADVWTGGVDVQWYIDDDDATEYVLDTAEELAGLAVLVNEGPQAATGVALLADSEATNVTFENVTIKLGGDIDLNNAYWTPIGRSHSVRFLGTFDGQGHTVSNFQVNVDEFAGLFGTAAQGVIKNVNIENATIKANDYAGGLIGWTYADVENCHATNVKVTTTPYLKDDGKTYDGGAKAGGVVGAMGEGSGTTMANCSAKNVQISAYRDLGGVVGMIHTNNTFTNGSAENVTLNYITASPYADDKKNENAGTVYGRVNDGAVISGTDNQAKEMVSTADELQEALNAGSDVVLTDDVATEAETTAPYGNKVGLIQNGGVIDGAGNTLSVECYGDDYGIMTSGGTIKNLTIDEGCRAIMIMSPTEDIILDNLYVAGDILYPINTGEHPTVDGIDLIVTNSTFGGWTSFAGIESASFTNCEFIYGNYGYGWPYDCLVKPYVNTLFDGCDFAGGYYIDLSALGADCKVTLKNCSVNGTVITSANFESLMEKTEDLDSNSDKFFLELPDGRDASDCIIIK